MQTLAGFCSDGSVACKTAACSCNACAVACSGESKAGLGEPFFRVGYGDRNKTHVGVGGGKWEEYWELGLMVKRLQNVMYSLK